MDFKCDCGWKIINADENYVVTCRCGKPMKPLMEKTESRAEVLCSVGLEGLNERVKELEAWVIDCRDKILYPLAHGDTEMGRLADGFGSSTVELLRKAD